LEIRFFRQKGQVKQGTDLNRQYATVAARLRQKERQTEKYAHDVRTCPLAAHAVCIAFWRFKKTFFLLKDRLQRFFLLLTNNLKFPAGTNCQLSNVVYICAKFSY
jgi:hypothetical protein